MRISINNSRSSRAMCCLCILSSTLEVSAATLASTFRALSPSTRTNQLSVHRDTLRRRYRLWSGCLEILPSMHSERPNMNRVGRERRKCRWAASSDDPISSIQWHTDSSRESSRSQRFPDNASKDAEPSPRSKLLALETCQDGVRCCSISRWLLTGFLIW